MGSFLNEEMHQETHGVLVDIVEGIIAMDEMVKKCSSQVRFSCIACGQDAARIADGRRTERLFDHDLNARPNEYQRETSEQRYVNHHRYVFNGDLKRMDLFGAISD